MILQDCLQTISRWCKTPHASAVLGSEGWAKEHGSSFSFHSNVLLKKVVEHNINAVQEWIGNVPIEKTDIWVKEGMAAEADIVKNNNKKQHRKCGHRAEQQTKGGHSQAHGEWLADHSRDLSGRGEEDDREDTATFAVLVWRCRGRRIHLMSRLLLLRCALCSSRRVEHAYVFCFARFFH